MRQDSYGRAQVGVRRVQPVRHLRRHLQADLSGTGERGLSFLSGEVPKVVQGFGLQDLQGRIGRKERSGNEDQKKDSLKTNLKKETCEFASFSSYVLLKLSVFFYS